ncbi:MAG: HPP family protein [bacterium]
MNYSNIRAKDIMKRDVIIVKENTQICEAIKTLLDNQITGLPVVSDDMSLVGIVTEKDLMKLLDRLDVKRMLRPISDVITRDVVTFNEDEDMNIIYDCFMTNTFRRVPILSKKGKLVGIISRRDIIKSALIELGFDL